MERIATQLSFSEQLRSPQDTSNLQHHPKSKLQRNVSPDAHANSISANRPRIAQGRQISSACTSPDPLGSEAFRLLALDGQQSPLVSTPRTAPSHRQRPQTTNIMCTLSGLALCLSASALVPSASSPTPFSFSYKLFPPLLPRHRSLPPLPSLPPRPSIPRPRLGVQRSTFSSGARGHRSSSKTWTGSSALSSSSSSTEGARRR